MDQSPQPQVQAYLARLDALIRAGQRLRQVLLTDSSRESTIRAIGAWQQECGMTISQLSGGSKAHWLARSFSQAFLMRSTAGRAIENAPAEEIIDRLLDVLKQAVAALSGSQSQSLASAATPEPHRFDFVHKTELRPVLEQAYSEGRGAFEQGDYPLAMLTWCGILESIVTDAIEHHDLSAAVEPELSRRKIADWTFEARLIAAEKAGLITHGWVRLPEAARTYRDQAEHKSNPAISERDAKRTAQVLHVVMRDLNPGR